jgi:hypothetical protein
MRYDKRNTIVSASSAVAILAIATGAYFAGSSVGLPKFDLAAWGADTGITDISSTKIPLRQAAEDPLGDQSVELSATQLKTVKVEAVGEHSFPIEKEAVGSIDFNQEMSVQVSNSS